MRTHPSIILGVAILSVGLAASSARADALIDFSTSAAGKGGTVSFAGGSSPLVGANIRIGIVTGVETPAHADAHAVVGNAVPYGILNFTTGTFESYSNGVYTFGDGGSFELYGNVPDAGVYGAGAGALLFTGTFDTASIGRVGAINRFTASGIDTWENPVLLDFFGLPPSTLFEFSSYVSAVGLLGGGGPFSVTAFNTDWANPDPPAPEIESVIPEPGSLLLFGSGLIGLAMAIRRRTPGRPTDAVPEAE